MIGPPAAEKIHGDHTVFFSQHRNDRIEHSAGSRIAMQQDQRRACSMALIIDLMAAIGKVTHRCTSP